MSILKLTILKYLKQIFRSRNKTGLLILTPIIFFSFFGFVFSGLGEGTVVRRIGVVNNDVGFDGDITSAIPEQFNVLSSYQSLSQLYLQLFENHTSLIVNTEIEIQIIEYSNNNDLIADLETQDIHLGMILPEEFTVSILHGINQLTNSSLYDVDVEDGSMIIETYGDQTTGLYQSATSLVTQSIESFLSGFVGLDALYTEKPDGGYLNYKTNSVQSDVFSQVEFFIPGFIVFLIILQAITIAGALAYEKEKNTIMRMKLSKMYSWELFMGITIGQMIAFTVQFLISIVVLSYWGIDLDMIGWLKVFLITQLTNINIIGISLIIASFVNTVENAGTITGIGSAPLGFLSGSFLEVPEVWVIKSLNLQFWDLIPTYHGTDALKQIIFYDATLLDIWVRIVALTVFTLVFYLLGMVVYNRRVVRGDI